MKILVIAMLVLIVLFGGAAYIAAAGILIIYALGNTKATKEKRTAFGLLGALMFYLSIYTFIYLIKNGGAIF